MRTCHEDLPQPKGYWLSISTTGWFVTTIVHATQRAIHPQDCRKTKTTHYSFLAAANRRETGRVGKHHRARVAVAAMTLWLQKVIARFAIAPRILSGPSVQTWNGITTDTRLAFSTLINAGRTQRLPYTGARAASKQYSKTIQPTWRNVHRCYCIFVGIVGHLIRERYH